MRRIQAVRDSQLPTRPSAAVLLDEDCPTRRMHASAEVLRDSQLPTRRRLVALVLDENTESEALPEARGEPSDEHSVTVVDHAAK